MKILAFDTSTEYCSVAVWADGVMSARDVSAGQRHSELLLPLVGEMLAERSLSLRALDGIAFGCGPGSFTGLRIGCAVAQGLAFGADLPVIGVCTLLALAQGGGRPCAEENIRFDSSQQAHCHVASCREQPNPDYIPPAKHSGRVIACLDARMGEVYHAAYERDSSGWREVWAPGLYAPQDAPSVAGEGWTGCGSGFAVHGEALRKRYAGQLQCVNAAAFPSARDIALLAAPRFANGEGGDAALAAPLYLRNKVALKTSER